LRLEQWQKTYDYIKTRYDAGNNIGGIYAEDLNRTAKIGDEFFLLGKTTDSYILAMNAEVTEITETSTNYKCLELAVVHDPNESANENVTTKGLAFTPIGNNEYDVYADNISSKNIVIPHIYKDFIVTLIREYAFSENTTIESVIMGDFIENIENQAFYQCSSLKRIVWGRSLKTIGYSAFEGCSSLETIKIPDSVITIGSSAFQDCSNVTLVEIPKSVIEIEDYAFAGLNDRAIIYCDFSEKPMEWGENWNGSTHVVWRG
jgi:hypothetical protein